jgi:aryl-alcohol dehydrogenase-like predicted oxidoreductase
MKNKLVLGTANFGKKKYTKESKKLSKFKIKKIINYAVKNGIVFFDTANSYESEENIKEKNISIFTKLKPIKENLKIKSHDEIDKIIFNSISKSQRNLKTKKIFCILLHRVDDLLIHNGYVVKQLVKLKKKGLINNIGISIDRYTNIKKIIFNKNIKYIQIPVNIYDNRWKIFFNKKFIKYSQNKIFIARSIFLRGLFSKKNWPNKINKYRTQIDRLNKKIMKKLIIKKIEELMFLYVKSLNIFEYIIFGASSTRHIKQISNFKKLREFNKNEIKYIQKITKNIRTNFYNIINWN